MTYWIYRAGILSGGNNFFNGRVEVQKEWSWSVFLTFSPLFPFRPLTPSAPWQREKTHVVGTGKVNTELHVMTNRQWRKGTLSFLPCSMTPTFVSILSCSVIDQLLHLNSSDTNDSSRGKLHPNDICQPMQGASTRLKDHRGSTQTSCERIPNADQTRTHTHTIHTPLRQS